MPTSRSRPTAPIDAAMALDASTLPALNVLSHQVRRTVRLPASAPTAAVAGPMAGGRSSAASKQKSAPRLTFCSGPIFTGNRSVKTIATRHMGTSAQRHGSGAARPPRAATAASATPSAGTPRITARSGGLRAPNPRAKLELRRRARPGQWSRPSLPCRRHRTRPGSDSQTRRRAPKRFRKRSGREQ